MPDPTMMPPMPMPQQQGQQPFMDPFQQWRGLLQTTPAAQGMLSNFQAPNYGGTTPQRSVPLWFGGPLPKGQGQGTAPWASPQQNSYWPQILALLQNPLLLPQAPGVQPIPGLPPQQGQGGQQPPPTPSSGGQLPIPPMPQLPPVFPGGGALPPGSIPPPTPGTGGAGTVMPPTNTLPLPPAALPKPPGETPPVGTAPAPVPVKRKVTAAVTGRESKR